MKTKTSKLRIKKFRVKKLEEKQDQCEHFFDSLDKWYDSDMNPHWEFYCKYCLMIRVIIGERGK